MSDWIKIFEKDFRSFKTQYEDWSSSGSFLFSKSSTTVNLKVADGENLGGCSDQLNSGGSATIIRNCCSTGAALDRDSCWDRESGTDRFCILVARPGCSHPTTPPLLVAIDINFGPAAKCDGTYAEYL